MGTLPVHPIIAQPRLLLRVWESLQGIPNDLGRGVNFLSGLFPQIFISISEWRSWR